MGTSTGLAIWVPRHTRNGTLRTSRLKTVGSNRAESNARTGLAGLGLVHTYSLRKTWGSYGPKTGLNLSRTTILLARRNMLLALLFNCGLGALPSAQSMPLGEANLRLQRFWSPEPARPPPPLGELLSTRNYSVEAWPQPSREAKLAEASLRADIAEGRHKRKPDLKRAPLGHQPQLDHMHKPMAPTQQAYRDSLRRVPLTPTPGEAQLLVDDHSVSQHRCAVRVREQPQKTVLDLSCPSTCNPDIKTHDTMITPCVNSLFGMYGSVLRVNGKFRMWLGEYKVSVVLSGVFSASCAEQAEMQLAINALSLPQSPSLLPFSCSHPLLSLTPRGSVLLCRIG